ncbi:hypothetical protein SCAR479_06718 [Seiridium cardinale]|uniref:Uncharacterized protein n=1 Tax=Seiridium cardinale TaxID=138064 RepID=A0ABR2XS80_9PEZI
MKTDLENTLFNDYLISDYPSALFSSSFKTIPHYSLGTIAIQMPSAQPGVNQTRQPTHDEMLPPIPPLTGASPHFFVIMGYFMLASTIASNVLEFTPQPNRLVGDLLHLTAYAGSMAIFTGTRQLFSRCQQQCRPRSSPPPVGEESGRRHTGSSVWTDCTEEMHPGLGYPGLGYPGLAFTGAGSSSEG